MLRRSCLKLHRTSGLSSCLTHFTHPTWHQATSTDFDFWSSTFAERGFSMMMSCNRSWSRISTTSPEILFDWNKRTFWQMWKSVLMYREITLKNNVIVLSVPFVHQTELQNVLIAFRIYDLVRKYLQLITRNQKRWIFYATFYLSVTSTCVT